MSTTKEDRSFKTLINRETTDSVNKFFFNELGADTINVHADDIWSESIPFNDPAQAVTIGVAELRTLFVMTEDLTVPNNQSWKVVDPPGTITNPRLRDWISPKFGNLFGIRLFDNNDIEIFITDPVGWFFDYQTGILTFDGNASSKARPFKITGYRYIGAKGAGDGGGSVATKEALSIPIDYNLVGAATITPGIIFTTQDAIDDYLLLAGTTAFKYIKEVYDALPSIIIHNVVFNLAAGIHRPRVGDIVPFDMQTKTILGGGHIVWQGTLSSTWTAFDPSLSTLAIASVVTAGGNPSITFVGTPLTGFDLEGTFAVISTGQVTTIHKHDNSTIYLCDALSPVPVPGTHTVKIALPSTDVRNSLDDITPFTTSTFGNWRTRNAAFGSSTAGNRFAFQDLKLTPWQSNGVFSGDGALNFLRIHIDRLTPTTENGNTFNYTGIQTFSFTTCSYRGKVNLAQEDIILSYNGTGIVQLTGCFFRGSEDGLYFNNVRTVGCRSLVLRNVGRVASFSLNASMQFDGGTSIDFNNFSGHKVNEIRGTNPGVGGLAFIQGATVRDDARPEIIFTDCQGPCIKVFSGSILPANAGSTVSGQPAGFDDGGGNTDVGIQVDGPHSSISVDSNSNVTGALGSARLNGTIVDYLALLAGDNIIDAPTFSSIRRT